VCLGATIQSVRATKASIAAGRSGLPQVIDQIPAQFRNAARNGGGGGFGGFGGGQQSALTTWVTQHCTAVPPGLWQSTATSGNAGFGGANRLYSCAQTH